jgi:ubiquinone/menaquinone biosynthesis C-methylase UbiE
MSTIIKYYDEHAESEWKRLRRDAYHRLEFIVTTHFLEEYLPKTGVVLDAGGGPGRYSIELAKRGYDVVLLDISPKCLELARKKIARAHVGNRVKQIIEGSIIDMSVFNDEQFDAVLCLGPFSHLIEKHQREKAANEIVRVAKTGAPLFISVIGLLGVFRTVLQRLPYELTDLSHVELVYIDGMYPATKRNMVFLTLVSGIRERSKNFLKVK